MPKTFTDPRAVVPQESGVPFGQLTASNNEEGGRNLKHWATASALSAGSVFSRAHLYMRTRRIATRACVRDPHLQCFSISRQW